MTFNDKYAALEREFQEQVENDDKELGINSSYLPNFNPGGPVDYVLIAMEPSTGVPGKGRVDPSGIPKNFSWSVEDFIFHYCVRNYLCQDRQTYHLTDLAKGSMTTFLANKQRRHRYERWYPLLEKELQLLGKPEGTRLIAIGKVVADFLNSKFSSQKIERVLHYTRNAAPHRDRLIEPWREYFLEFSESVDENAFTESIKDVLIDADMEPYIIIRPEGGKAYTLTESRKKLMFYYKNRFNELKRACPMFSNFGNE